MRVVAVHREGDRSTAPVALGIVERGSADGSVVWVRIIEWNGVPVPIDQMEGLQFYYVSWLSEVPTYFI